MSDDEMKSMNELHMRLQYADCLAAAVLELIDMGLLDTRSKAADALLRYCGARIEHHGAEEINEFRLYAESTGIMKAEKQNG